MKKLFAVISAVCLFSALCYYFYTVRHVEVFGHSFTRDNKELSFSGQEITDVDSLMDELKQFPALKSVDLGSFMVHADRESELRSAFPNTDFSFDTFIVLFGEKIDTDVETLDLSSKDGISVTTLKSALPYLSNLKAVSFGDNTIKHEEKEDLCSSFPEIDFDVISTYDVYGKTVKDNVEKLDLTDTEPDANLSSVLKCFENLKEVDLHGKGIPADEQLSLVKEFPNVDFGWEVEFNGQSYDSLSETLDLSNSWWINDVETVNQILPLFPKLKYLDMSDCGISNEDMAAFRDAHPEMRVVWMLHMGRWYLKTDAVAFSVLIYDYSHRRLTTDDIQVLQYCTDLKALDIGHQAVTDISVIGDFLPELRILILADNAVSDLSPLAKLKHLHYLEFFVNQVTDISPLAECKELVDLNISYNYRISDITPLLDLPLLERLWLESTSVSEEDAQLLRNTYPNATVINHGSGSVDQGWRGHERYWAMIDMYHNNYLSELFSMYDQ